MQVSRRNFLQSLSVCGVPLLLPRISVGREIISSPSEHFIRRDVSLMADSDPILSSYKKAVDIMKKLPSSDHRNWTNQALIHNNLCPHYNWYFLPWHRSYLYYFEQICRQLSGNPQFALPYWNWTTTPKIPATFWGDGNPLNDGTRIAQPTSIADSRQVGSATIESILKIKSFETFASGKDVCYNRYGSQGGQLESTPHNYIHAGFVLGDMGKMMSPLDPIFWLHHANIDRLWNEWNSRGNRNSTDGAWVNCDFINHFYDVTGNPISMTVSKVLSTKALGYVYDDDSEAFVNSLTSSFSLMDAGLKGIAENLNSIRTNEFISARLDLSQGFFKTIDTLRTSVANHPNDEIIKLYIEGVQLPAIKDFYLRVFMNCDYVGPDVPVTDPVSIGFINFFGNHTGDGDMMQHETHHISYVFEVTDNIKRLTAERKINQENIRVQILAIPYKSTGSSQEIKAQSIRLEVQRRENQ